MKRSLPKWMCQVPKSGTGTIDLPWMALPDTCKVTYSHNEKDCSILCSQITSTLPSVIGFDMEWVPSRKKQSENKTAVIQICTQPNKDCFVFHIAKIGGIPVMLKTLIENKNIVKTGIGVGRDLWKLYKDFDIDWRATQNSCVDLSELAKALSIFPDTGSNWSLQALTKRILAKSLSKSKTLQLGNWDAFPLNSDQIQYAALDAYISLCLYETLHKQKCRS